MAAISSRTSSSLKLPTLTPGICSAEASKVSVPADSGSGDRPGSVNEVVPSNTLIDHRRLPDQAVVRAREHAGQLRHARRRVRHVQRGQDERDAALGAQLERGERAHVVLSLIHISEPTRQAEISYAVLCLKKKKEIRRIYPIVLSPSGIVLMLRR